MNDYIKTLQQVFQENAQPAIAKEQKAYLRNQFDFYGLKTPVRRELQRPFLLKSTLPSKEDAFKIVKILWATPQRENQYFAQEFVKKYVRQFEKEDIHLLEFIVINKS